MSTSTIEIRSELLRGAIAKLRLGRTLYICNGIEKTLDEMRPFSDREVKRTYYQQSLALKHRIRELLDGHHSYTTWLVAQGALPEYEGTVGDAPYSGYIDSLPGVLESRIAWAEWMLENWCGEQA